MLKQLNLTKEQYPIVITMATTVISTVLKVAEHGPGRGSDLAAHPIHGGPI